MNNRLLRVSSIVAASLMCLLASACGGSSEGGQASGAPGGSTAGSAQGKTVAFLTLTPTCEYCALHSKAFNEVAKAAGVKIDEKSTNFNASEQAQQVAQAVASKPDAIVLYPADSTAIIPSLARIKAAKIPLVITNSAAATDDASLWTAFTGPDDYQNGVMAAEAMLQGFKAKDLPMSGGVLVIIGTVGHPASVGRLKGLTETLAQKAPDIKVLANQPGNWDQTVAQDAAAGLYTANKGKFQGVYAAADNMAAGAIQAAKSQGLPLDKMVFIGSNCSIEGYTNIKSGDQFGTVFQNPTEDGSTAAKAVVEVLEGKQPKTPQIISHEIITKANVEDCASAVK